MFSTILFLPYHTQDPTTFFLTLFLWVPHCDGVRGEVGKVSADVGLLTDSDGYRHWEEKRIGGW